MRQIFWYPSAKCPFQVMTAEAANIHAETSVPRPSIALPHQFHKHQHCIIFTTTTTTTTTTTNNNNNNNSNRQFVNHNIKRRPNTQVECSPRQNVSSRSVVLLECYLASIRLSALSVTFDFF